MRSLSCGAPKGARYEKTIEAMASCGTISLTNMPAGGPIAEAKTGLRASVTKSSTGASRWHCGTAATPFYGENEYFTSKEAANLERATRSAGQVLLRYCFETEALRRRRVSRNCPWKSRRDMIDKHTHRRRHASTMRHKRHDLRTDRGVAG
jgi:hypothetical protein